ncbi:transposase [Clostridium sp. C105KSO13]|uniref:transposase n=1 Tax=Clostridium sp. C105KSO13 TaxID=1776045 RepID=UPI0007405AE8|nr:transposase [Clostridium sp. C105KSO13]CUX19854.1 Transposase IS200 like protein [Clostridium sp. C105KSO13]
MSRDKRRESGTGFYHVVMRGNNKEKVFNKTGDKLEFKNILKKQLDEYPVTIYAYCIMTNHIHLMLEAKYKVLPRFMQRVNSTYAEGYNSKYDRHGHVFQGRYYSDCVETEEYYWCCLRYIHNNPVKVYLAGEPFSYQFSSAWEYKNGASELIGEAAFNMLKTRFQNMDDFWRFHRMFEQKSFLDTVEDEQIHNTERVRIFTERYLFDNRIEEMETLLTVGTIKRKFFETCKQETGLSQRKIENILKTAYKRD